MCSVHLSNNKTRKWSLALVLNVRVKVHLVWVFDYNLVGMKLLMVFFAKNTVLFRWTWSKPSTTITNELLFKKALGKSHLGDCLDQKMPSSWVICVTCANQASISQNNSFNAKKIIFKYICRRRDWANRGVHQQLWWLPEYCSGTNQKLQRFVTPTNLFLLDRVFLFLPRLSWPIIS